MISRILFESPWVLLLTIGGAEALLAAWWWRRRSAWLAHGVWAGAMIAAALLSLSHWVVTPREQVVRLCRLLAERVEQADVGGIGVHLAGEFAAGGFARDELLERLRQTLRRYQVDHAALRGFDVRFPAPDRAEAVFDAVCRVRGDERWTDWLMSRWRVTMQRHTDDWLVVAVEALPAPFSPIRNVRDCLR